MFPTAAARRVGAIQRKQTQQRVTISWQQVLVLQKQSRSTSKNYHRNQPHHSRSFPLGDFLLQ